jgi:hypothetical protein
LSQPFVYIRKVNNKEEKEKNFSSHPDLWNKSTNVVSKRQQRSFPKSEITKETISNFMQSGSNRGEKSRSKSLKSKEERNMLYQENLVVLSRSDRERLGIA